MKTFSTSRGLRPRSCRNSCTSMATSITCERVRVRVGVRDRDRVGVGVRVRAWVRSLARDHLLLLPRHLSLTL